VGLNVASTKPPMVAGIDRCRRGWVVVVDDGQSMGVEVLDGLDSVVADARNGKLEMVAVDMPIGLLSRHPRSCDQQARQYISPRGATVFPAPVRAALEASTYEEACQLSRLSSGKAVSRQTYGLFPPIVQLDQLINADDDRIVEAHPECAFTRLAGGVPPVSKHTSQGMTERIGLLRAALGSRIDDALHERKAPVLDVLDAAVLTITARHVVNGTAIRFGGETDTTGKVAQILT